MAAIKNKKQAKKNISVPIPTYEFIRTGLTADDDKRDIFNYLLRADIKKMTDEESILNFCRIEGYDALKVPIIDKHFKILVNKLRDPLLPSDEREEIKSSLDKLIRALSHHDKRKRLFRNYSVRELNKFLKRCEKIFKQIKMACSDCTFDYASCETRTNCEELKHQVGRNINNEEYVKFTGYSSLSDFLQAEGRQYGINRNEGYKLLTKYRQYIKEYSENKLK